MFVFHSSVAFTQYMRGAPTIQFHNKNIPLKPFLSRISTEQKVVIIACGKYYMTVYEVQLD